MTGNEALCSALEQLGVKHVFGLPGTQNVDLFEALRRSSLRTILATHELAAGFMANGYYRASGKPGVLTTIPGPGFAFTVAAIAEASQDSAALVYITGKPAGQTGRKYNLQEIDQKSILAPLVKRVIEVETPGEIVSATREAYRTATAGEPGPVLLQLDPRCLSASDAESPTNDVPPPVTSLPPEELREAARLLSASQRVVLFAGQGANDAPQQLRELAEWLGAPVVTTRSGRGVVPEDHPLVMQFDFSDQGVRSLNSILDRSDLILAIGCKFTHNGTYGFKLRFPQDKLIHVDSSAEVLQANYPARLAICADAAAFLDGLRQLRESFARPNKGWDEREIESFKDLASRKSDAVEPAIQGVEPATPAGFFAALRRAMPPDACLVTDSGLHQVLATRHFRALTPRGMVIPSDFQSMGFGLPAAIGAKLAEPDRNVVALIGDGGLAMSGMEILVAVRERIPITVIVFNDGALGQIRLQQISSFGRTHATSLLNPDLQLFAEALGAAYVRLESDGERTLREVFNSGRVTLVEVSVADSNGMFRERVKGLGRSSARRVLTPSLLRWVKSRLG